MNQYYDIDHNYPKTEDGRHSGADKRARMDPSIREARAKLTHRTAARPEFEHELLYLYAQNSLKTSILLPLIGILVTLANMAWTPGFVALSWFSVLILSSGSLIFLCRHMSHLPRKKINVSVWRTRFMAAEFVHGTVWASTAYFGLNSGDDRAHMFVFVALTVVNALRMMLANATLGIVYAGTLPITVALFARFAWLNTDFFWAMATMAVGVQIFFMYLISQLHTNTLTMLELRAEKDSLIADLEQATAMSEEGRRRAEAANLAKSRFLATMSHELRTPLNAIIGFSEMMKDEMLGPHKIEAYRMYSEDIHNSGQHLLNLINEILDITRIEAGKYDLNEEAVSLADIAEQCCNMVKMRADGKGLTLVQTYQADLERLWADERAIRQICLNLLSNAVKFTPNGGRIVITAGHTSDGGQYISVKDNGPGIPEDELPRVLTSFGQGSLAHENAEGGTGLGLPIVRGLINLHGGVFDLKTKLREGTEVIAMFPKKRVLQIMPQVSARQEQTGATTENETVAQADESSDANRRRAPAV